MEVFFSTFGKKRKLLGCTRESHKEAFRDRDLAFCNQMLRCVMPVVSVGVHRRQRSWPGPGTWPEP